MKKLMKLFALLLVFGALVFSLACNDEATVESISVLEDSVPSEILLTEVDDKIDDIKIEVKKSDDSVETINLTKSMISEDDYKKLSTEGTHTIKVTYEGKEVSLTLVVKEAGQVEPGPDDPEKEPIPYSVLIKDIAGKPLSGFYVTFYLEDEIVAEGYSNNNGLFETELEPNIYEVAIDGSDMEAYYLNKDFYETDLMGTQIEVECHIESLEGKEADSSIKYELGDVMYDFTLTDTDGNELNLYNLLDEYKLVVLNFWYTTCSACYYEFPAMVEAYGSTYEKNGETLNYKDDVIIIAINPGIAGNGDTFEDIKNFKDQNGITFNVAMDYDFDESNLTADPALTQLFSVEGYPTTVMVDSFGLIADITVGAETETVKWTSTFDKYLVDDYYPVYTGEVADDDFVKPDITQEDSSVLEEAVNGTNHDGTKFAGTYAPEDGEDAEFSWPWVVAEFNGVKCIKPSNKGQDPSYSIVYTTVEMKKGEVFAFDYYASTEEYDILYVIVNNTIATQISGQSPDWEKSYAYVAIEDGTYEIAICYMKDSSYSIGEDAVYITNVRLVKEEQVDKTTYIFRECAMGAMDEINMKYSKYVDVVYNEVDGYYHVDNENGPLLLADMLSGTKWNNSTLYEISLEGKCIGADGVDYNKLVEEYAVYASNSEIGYTPVTKELADGLKQIVKALGDAKAANNPNQWLELCVYYSAYGTDGEELGLPTVGVCPFEPIEFDGDGLEVAAKAEATFDRIILPRGFIFGFTPKRSGVYKFYGTEEALETLGWICDADGVVIAESEYGLRIYAEQSSKGEQVDHNFIAYVYLVEGETYLFRAAFYDVYEYSTITVEMKYVAESVELLTIASPGFFTSSDDEMSDVISGNYVDVELGEDGFYRVKDSLAKDTYLYCDFEYINNITTYPLKECLSERFNAFDFSKDEFGQPLYDEEGYFRQTLFDENNEMQRYYVCYKEGGELEYVATVGADGKTEENGYTYIKLTAEEMEKMEGANCTEYVKEYVQKNMITDENSEVYGCVKVDEQFAYVLGMLMDKYTFADIEYSWVKLCYYYKFIGPVVSE